ncbi:MAG: ATP-binding protein [Clostridia bacterium]|nr:ATP-binding protein [Clostridia bacterium]
MLETSERERLINAAGTDDGPGLVPFSELAKRLSDMMPRLKNICPEDAGNMRDKGIHGPKQQPDGMEGLSGMSKAQGRGQFEKAYGWEMKRVGDEEWEAAQRKRAEDDADGYNAITGTLNLADGIDCPLCKNKGMIASAVKATGYWSMVMRQCECKNARNAFARIRTSGLAPAIKRCRFDNFEAREPWQIQCRDKAMAYAKDGSEQWLYVGGQVGAGKSHLCTAVCGELLMVRNMSVVYMLWTTDAVRMKALHNEQLYNEQLIRYLNAEVLYIDDFLKVPRSKENNVYSGRPTDADLRLAFDILNGRYLERKRTIISSEWLLSEIGQFDDGLESRIVEMSRNFRCQIARNPERNYRKNYNDDLLLPECRSAGWSERDAQDMGIC